MMIMTIFKYFESEIQASKGKTGNSEIIASLAKWLSAVENHKNLNVNAKFDALLNIYLVLGNETNMKCEVFKTMVNFLNKHEQLEQVMVKQVQDISILSEEWNLTKDQRFDLYICCAEALEEVGYHNDSFKVFLIALKIKETGNKNQKVDKSL